MIGRQAPGRRPPLIPTVIVLAAVGVMIALGFWQLERRAEKEDLLVRYRAAAFDHALAPWPRGAAHAPLYRRAQLDCARVAGMSAMAGQNAAGESGLAITVRCNPEGENALIVLGWSRQLVVPEWAGGTVSGIIAPGPRLVADPPLAGLQANAVPDPSGLPNNHLAYAVQWFLFALAALAIYALALRKRLAGRRTDG